MLSRKRRKCFSGSSRSSISRRSSGGNGVFFNKQAILAGLKRYKVLQALQEHKGESEQRAAVLVSSYVTGKIVAFALAEAVAIYGFALVLTSHYFVGQYILSIASGVLLLLEFPSRRLLTDLVTAAEGELA